MPTYEYICSNEECKGKDVFEVEQKITEEAFKVCPFCGKTTIKRLISSSAISFKGTGWTGKHYI